MGNFEQAIRNYLPAIQTDLAAFAPETILAGTIVALLLVPVLSPVRLHMRWLALAGMALAFWTSYQQWTMLFNLPSTGKASTSPEIFDGLLVVDLFTCYLRLFLFGFTGLTIVLTILTGIPDAEDSADFYTLLLGAVIGMSIMASANHLLMIFLGVEMASVPSYALAGFLKGRRQSSEAALKYVVYGGAAAGVMLYGITLLAGMYGTLRLPTLAQSMLVDFNMAGAGTFNSTLLLALSLVLVGLAFKLAAFPFHFWCPDVFEGAAAEVAGFLSVASKGAAVALLIRIVEGFVGMYGSAPFGQRDWQPAIEAMAHYLTPALAVMAAVTCTFGNLAAFGQTNLKRLLGYSTIAHAGYMMLAIVPLSLAGVKAALFYLVIYLFMNLGAFAVVALVRNQTGSEDIDAYRGLIQREPLLAVCMTVFFLSLLGMPPLAGFAAKFQIFAVLYEQRWYSLLVIGGINTVLSLVYYINVVRVMVFLPPEGRLAPAPTGANAFVFALAVPVVLLGIFWTTLDTYAGFSARSLQNPRMSINSQRRMVVDSPPPAARSIKP